MIDFAWIDANGSDYLKTLDVNLVGTRLVERLYLEERAKQEYPDFVFLKHSYSLDISVYVPVLPSDLLLLEQYFNLSPTFHAGLNTSLEYSSSSDKIISIRPSWMLGKYCLVKSISGFNSSCLSSQRLDSESLEWIEACGSDYLKGLGSSFSPILYYRERGLREYGNRFQLVNIEPSDLDNIRLPQTKTDNRLVEQYTGLCPIIIDLELNDSLPRRKTLAISPSWLPTNYRLVRPFDKQVLASRFRILSNGVLTSMFLLYLSGMALSVASTSSRGCPSEIVPLPERTLGELHSPLE